MFDRLKKFGKFIIGIMVILIIFRIIITIFVVTTV